MKVTVDIDCTPEEARRFMGLPDLGPVHEAYVAKMRTILEDGVGPDSAEALLRSWMPLGEAGLSMWQRLIEQIGKSGGA